MKSIKREVRTIKGKRRYYYVARDKGRIVSAISVKGLRQAGVKRSDLVRRLKSSKSFKKEVFDRDTFSTGVVRELRSKPPRYKKHAQVAVTVMFGTRYGKRKYTFTGYSNKGLVGGEGEAQALGRAIKQATLAGLKYDNLIIEDVNVTYIAWYPSRRKAPAKSRLTEKVSPTAATA